MSDKKAMPVDGGGRDKGADDGVNTPGRGGGGDSQGGAYDNPHTGKDGDSDFGGFFGHGGQTEIAYHGSGQTGSKGDKTANATTEGGDSQGGGETGPKPGPTGPEEGIALEYSREIEVDGRPIEVVDTSGIAAAEAAGTTGVGGQERTEDNPGSG